MKRIGILASGTGTNFLALLRASQEGKFDGRVICLVSDKKKSGALEKAASENLPCLYIPFDKKAEESKRLHENQILQYLKSHQVDTVVLAGFMRVLSKEFLDEFSDSELGGFRVINIHPTLLPAFPGKYGYEQAWVKGVRVAGCTVHFVDEKIDCGPIILQRGFDVSPWESLDSLKTKGLSLENKTYIESLKLYCSGRIKIEQRTFGKYSEKIVTVFN